MQMCCPFFMTLFLSDLFIRSRYIFLSLSLSFPLQYLFVLPFCLYGTVRHDDDDDDDDEE